MVLCLALSVDIMLVSHILFRWNHLELIDKAIRLNYDSCNICPIHCRYAHVLYLSCNQSFMLQYLAVPVDIVCV